MFTLFVKYKDKQNKEKNKHSVYNDFTMAIHAESDQQRGFFYFSIFYFSICLTLKTQFLIPFGELLRVI